MGRRKSRTPRSFNKLPPLHLVCSDDDLRPAMTGVYIHNKCAVATNAHILIVAKMEDHFKGCEEVLAKLEGKIIPAAAWKMLIGKVILELISVDEKSITFTRTLNGAPVALTYKFIESTFPEYQIAFPNLKDLKPVERIGFNASFIAPISKITRYSQLFLYFQHEHKSMIFKNADGDICGLLMPVLNAETAQNFTESIETAFPFIFKPVNSQENG